MNNTIEKWLNSNQIAESDKAIIKSYTNEELEESFSKNLEFGTAGMRALIGPGTNKMNLFTVKKATYGLGKYLLDTYQNVENKSVAIAYDSRYFSKEFSKISAEVLSSFGINVHVYDQEKPTPMLSFLVREYNCIGGIVITASHNPKEYNGYKVYNESGAQLNLVQADSLIKYVDQVTDILNLKYSPNHELINYVDEGFDEIYLKNVDVLINKNINKDIKIVFTPEHGTSGKIMLKAFKKYGFNNIICVEEQMYPDPEFSNTKSSNPEDEIAYELALKYAIKNDADLIIANDPDADRLGIMYREAKGIYKALSGNETGSLMIDYLLENKKHSSNDYIYKTIVTGEIGANIAREKGVNVVELLTGFKFIGEQILKNESNKDHNFIFGYEESYGYLLNTCARDKDAIQASLFISEIVSYYKQNNKTLHDRLNELYQQYGFYKEVTHSITLSGSKGIQKIKEVMNQMRVYEIKSIANIKITKKIDYLNDDTSLPCADVIKFYLDEFGWVVFRPSGTEPKLKIYISIKAHTNLEAEKTHENVYQFLLKFCKLD